MAFDCKDVRRRVFSYVMEKLSVVSERDRRLIAGLLASSDCRNLRRLYSFFDWHHWRWQAQPEGEDPLQIYKRVEEMICGCDGSPLASLLLYGAAFLTGIIVGYLVSIILG